MPRVRYLSEFELHVLPSAIVSTAMNAKPGAGEQVAPQTAKAGDHVGSGRLEGE